jgi:hypothetical protein
MPKKSCLRYIGWLRGHLNGNCASPHRTCRWFSTFRANCRLTNVRQRLQHRSHRRQKFDSCIQPHVLDQNPPAAILVRPTQALAPAGNRSEFGSVKQFPMPQEASIKTAVLHCMINQRSESSLATIMMYSLDYVR